MDGFHLPRAEIAGTPLMARRGAPDTFDADAFAETLRRIRDGADRDVSVPAFDHSSATPSRMPSRCPPDFRLVVVEGNYLLDPGPGWSAARAELDAVWYFDTPAEVRRARLEARHRQAGRSAADAALFVEESDERNAVLIARTASEADAVFTLDDLLG